MLILKTICYILLVVIYVTLNVQPLKMSMYFWVPIIACSKLTSLYINSMTNRFVQVRWKRILDIMLPIRTSSLCEYILVESLVYFSSLHPIFASLFCSSLLSIFQAYILALRVYFSLSNLYKIQTDRQIDTESQYLYYKTPVG